MQTEETEARYVVLLNGEGQYSLWSAERAVPDGWTIARDQDTKQACLEYIEGVWTDMRPRSLARAMARGKG